MKKYSINKARLMTRAWQIAKTLTGDIAARLSLALRTAKARPMLPMSTRDWSLWSCKKLKPCLYSRKRSCWSLMLVSSIIFSALSRIIRSRCSSRSCCCGVMSEILHAD